MFPRVTRNSSGILKSYLGWRHHYRDLKTTCACHMFWEPDEKGGYRDREDFSRQKRKDFWDKLLDEWGGFRNGFKDIRGEFKKMYYENREDFEDDAGAWVVHGSRRLEFDFKRPDAFDIWSTSTDGTHGAGYSQAALTRSPAGGALFQGYICTDFPKDGETKRAGFAAMLCDRKKKSFNRNDYYYWMHYNHLIMRVRGDGRTYAINISTSGEFDITWHDMYQYALYTRGGPYWQYVKIPFSKFFFSHKGRVQDLQDQIPLHQIAFVGITAFKLEGPFSLEIDYIGVEYDENEEEEFAYEMYKVPAGIPNS